MLWRWDTVVGTLARQRPAQRGIVTRFSAGERDLFVLRRGISLG